MSEVETLQHVKAGDHHYYGPLTDDQESRVERALTHLEEAALWAFQAMVRNE